MNPSIFKEKEGIIKMDVKDKVKAWIIDLPQTCELIEITFHFLDLDKFQQINIYEGADKSGPILAILKGKKKVALPHTVRVNKSSTFISLKSLPFANKKKGSFKASYKAYC